MKATRITENSIAGLKVASLPTRPTAPASYGGVGYTAADMKAAFDRLPLFLVEKYNDLIDSIEGHDDDAVATSILTGISPEHTLARMFTEIIDGGFAGYLSINGVSLLECIQLIYSKLEQLGSMHGINIWE